jgi:hypothetical protein
MLREVWLAITATLHGWAGDLRNRRLERRAARRLAAR